MWLRRGSVSSIGMIGVRCRRKTRGCDLLDQPELGGRSAWTIKAPGTMPAAPTKKAASAGASRISGEHIAGPALSATLCFIPGCRRCAGAELLCGVRSLPATLCFTRRPDYASMYSRPSYALLYSRPSHAFSYSPPGFALKNHYHADAPCCCGFRTSISSWHRKRGRLTFFEDHQMPGNNRYRTSWTYSMYPGRLA